jgi:lipopolysaccharide/colanic/teichoic acid biosynthesis glycosyltransferase
MTGTRALDVVVAGAGLLLLSPLLLILLAVAASDGWPPLYRGIRVGLGNVDFGMLKLRTMTAGAELVGGTSTARSDSRVTPVGRFMRRWKLDELPQLWNVLAGQMSLVGPRPNTRRGGVEHYTAQEMRLLAVRPGISDLSSIVFSDEGDILDGAADPDAAYDYLIRPWKSRLGLLYVERHNLADDLRIIALTGIAIVAKPLALRGVDSILARWEADEELRSVCRRETELPVIDAPGIAAE